MAVIVTPLSRLEAVIVERAPSHVITLLAPGDPPPSLPGIEHLKVGVDDISIPMRGFIAPDAAMVERVLEFGRGWPARAPLVIHCWAGISRSTASAFAIVCDRNPDVDEMGLAMAMRRASPSALPNRRIVALADDILGRDGRMLEAVEAMGGNGLAIEGSPFDVPYGP